MSEFIDNYQAGILLNSCSEACFYNFLIITDLGEAAKSPAGGDIFVAAAANMPHLQGLVGLP
ncbi:Uncharacterized protein dnm_059980 [Desulfonema magnum]|uniref:Uncharacterized protein n=1 Tax=Desulfonema magnum TaxID=45655 RepID=A0A975GQI8_9BACT|nr:Uncharacterized protein dnm_059980 [Desulfonema magnum]